MTLAQVKDITLKTPDGRLLQRRISFDVAPARLVLVRGPNGSGKSTLIKAIAGLGRVSSGEIRMNIPLERAQFLPQLENTETHMPVTLLDVVGLSQTRRVTVADACQFQLLSEQQLAASWNTASGGERKRALLTCALLSNPSLLILDEPMNHLDQASRKAMILGMASFLRASTPECPRAAVMVCHQGLLDSEKPLFAFDEINLFCQEETAWNP